MEQKQHIEQLQLDFSNNSDTDNGYIELFPGNWLYNAGVIGFIYVLEKCGIENIDELLIIDGSFAGNIQVCLNRKVEHKNTKIPKLIWKWLELSRRELKKDVEKIEDPVHEIWGTLFNVYYRGFFNANTKDLYQKSKSSDSLLNQLLGFFSGFNKYDENALTCSFCNRKNISNYKNTFSNEHFSGLGGSGGDRGMPNSFWNNDKNLGTHICDTCSFILLQKHFAFANVSGNTKVFINAPSFKLMYQLNRIVNEVYINNLNNRALLATSIIELASNTNLLFSQWTSMNIEIIEVKDKVRFFSLPYSTIKLISNRKIAELLSNIGEFSVLNAILEKNYNKISDIGYKLLKVGTKDITNKSDNDLVNSLLYQKRNKENILLTANKLFNLYALIQDRIKK